MLSSLCVCKDLLQWNLPKSRLVWFPRSSLIPLFQALLLLVKSKAKPPKDQSACINHKLTNMMYDIVEIIFDVLYDARYGLSIIYAEVTKQDHLQSWASVESSRLEWEDATHSFVASAPIPCYYNRKPQLLITMCHYNTFNLKSTLTNCGIFSQIRCNSPVSKEIPKLGRDCLGNSAKGFGISSISHFRCSWVAHRRPCDHHFVRIICNVSRLCSLAFGGQDGFVDGWLVLWHYTY